MAPSNSFPLIEVSIQLLRPLWNKVHYRASSEAYGTLEQSPLNQAYGTLEQSPLNRGWYTTTEAYGTKYTLKPSLRPMEPSNSLPLIEASIQLRRPMEQK